MTTTKIMASRLTSRLIRIRMKFVEDMNKRVQGSHDEVCRAIEKSVLSRVEADFRSIDQNIAFTLATNSI